MLYPTLTTEKMETLLQDQSQLNEFLNSFVGIKCIGELFVSYSARGGDQFGQRTIILTPTHILSRPNIFNFEDQSKKPDKTKDPETPKSPDDGASSSSSSSSSSCSSSSSAGYQSVKRETDEFPITPEA